MRIIRSEREKNISVFFDQRGAFAARHEKNPQAFFDWRVLRPVTGESRRSSDLKARHLPPFRLPGSAIPPVPAQSQEIGKPELLLLLLAERGG
ncbi:MAG TPA: hypothetical protein PKZ65_11985, partial [Methanoregulaceae archaeon]|nr:hypothetical protein [Methanoregulaceae archaeon]